MRAIESEMPLHRVRDNQLGEGTTPSVAHAGGHHALGRSMLDKQGRAYRVLNALILEKA